MKRATAVLLLLLAALALGPPTLATGFETSDTLAFDLADTNPSWTDELFVPPSLVLNLPEDSGFDYANFVDASEADSSKGALSGLVAGTFNMIKSAPKGLYSRSKGLFQKVNPMKLLSAREEDKGSENRDVAAYQGQPFPLAPKLVNHSKADEFSVFEKENARLMTAQRTVQEVNQIEEPGKGSRWGAPVLKMFILLEDYGR